MIKLRYSNITYALLIVLFTLANREIIGAAYCAIIVSFLYIFTHSFDHNIQLILFLIPCIRILDVCGFSFGINIILLLASSKYFLFEKNKVYSRKATKATFIVFILEAIHCLAYLDILETEIFGILNIVFNACVCFSVINDPKIKIDYEACVDALTYGVITSFLVFLFTNLSNVMQSLLNTGMRLSAYGHDPNYYSLYIILALYGKFISDKNSFIDIIEIVTLFAIELLTASKMGLICIILYLGNQVVTFLKDHSNKKFFLRLLIVGIFSILVFHDHFFRLYDKVLHRFNLREANTTLDAISSGRFSIVTQYLKSIVSAPMNLFLGYGILYNRRLKSLVAHNTYLDIFLSWGMLGSIFAMLGIIVFIKNQHLHFDKRNVACLLAFAFMLTSLSCLTADMFWYLLIYIVFTIRYTIV